MTPALTRMLRAMADAEAAGEWENAEVLADGLDVWVGDERYSRATLNAALRRVALRDVSDTKGAQRFALNSVGHMLLAAPDQEAAILQALSDGVSVTIRDNRVVPL